MIIEVNKLSKSYKVKTSSSFFNSKYKTIKALENLSFDLEENTCLGILGPNGAGKSTLIKILAGILYPDLGEVKVCNFSPHNRETEFKKKIGFFMGGKNQLIWDLPAIDSLKLSPYIYGYSMEEFKQRISLFKKHLNISDEINQPIRNMSLGQKMKMELIYSFLHFPKIVFLDEPTIGLDFITQKSLREFINLCKKELKITFLITSHNLKDITACCEQVLIIKDGQIIFNENVEKLDSYIFKKDKKIKFEFRDLKSAAAVAQKYSTENKGNLVFIKSSHEQAGSLINEIVSSFQVLDIQIIEEEMEDIIIRLLKDEKKS